MQPYFQNDLATIYHADCRQVIPHLPELDALVTDPPYSSGGMVRSDRMASTRVKYQSTDVVTEHDTFSGDNRDQRGFVAWASLWLAEILAKMAPGGAACMFSDWRQLPSMTDALQAGGWVWRGIIPWDKINARPQPDRFRAQCEYVLFATNGPRAFEASSGATYHPGIVRELPPNIRNRKHSTQKPVGIMRTLCAIAPPGGLVFDPFAGSGTTAEACAQIGRRFIGCELSERFCEITAKRLEAACAAAA